MWHSGKQTIPAPFAAASWTASTASATDSSGLDGYRTFASAIRKVLKLLERMIACHNAQTGPARALRLVDVRPDANRPRPAALGPHYRPGGHLLRNSRQ